mgnify:FL=1
MSVVIVYGSGMFCDNQCQDDNGAGIIADVTNRLRNRQDISSTDFLMERNCIFQVLTMKEQVLPAHIRKAKMDLK